MFVLVAVCEVIIMKLSQTKRAIEAREWRITKREKRRFDTLLSSYTSVKYGNVYKECIEFYHSLNKKYPKKHDLTKTKEYKRWKNQTTNDDESSNDNETEPAYKRWKNQPTNDDESTDDNETGPASTSTRQNSSDNNIIETEPASTAKQNSSDNETEPATTSEEPVQNILQIAAEDLIPDSPEIRNDIDNIIDDIVRELQQDGDIRDLLNAEMNGELVQPHYMDEDEGIGLNVDTELEAIFEPFDYELEVEGEDW